MPLIGSLNGSTLSITRITSRISDSSSSSFLPLSPSLLPFLRSRLADLFPSLSSFRLLSQHQRNHPSLRRPSVGEAEEERRRGRGGQGCFEEWRAGGLRYCVFDQRRVDAYGSFTALRRSWGRAREGEREKGRKGDEDASFVLVATELGRTFTD